MLKASAVKNEMFVLNIKYKHSARLYYVYFHIAVQIITEVPVKVIY